MFAALPSSPRRRGSSFSRSLGSCRQRCRLDSRLRGNDGIIYELAEMRIQLFSYELFSAQTTFSQ